MELITTVGAWALGSVSSYTAGLCLGFLPAFTSNIFSPVDSSLASDLGPRLSQNAAILLPGSADSTIATDRWQQYVVPNITVVVEVATESDIQQTVQYANKYNTSFLAVSGGHGETGNVGSMERGIEIWMRRMTSVQISSDGQSATIECGVKAKEVTDALWAANKQTGGFKPHESSLKVSSS